MSKDEIVKDEIIFQAQKLFKQFGLKKTTMDEIAIACGKAKSTLYHYFKSKEEVFDAVINTELTSLRDLISLKVGDERTLRDKLKTYFISFHQETVYKINLYRILKQEIKAEFSSHSRFNDIIEFETNFVNRLLSDGIKTGELTGIEEKNSKWFSELLVVAFLGVVKHAVMKDDVFDLNKLNKAANVIITRIII